MPDGSAVAAWQLSELTMSLSSSWLSGSRFEIGGCPNANCQNLGPGNPYTDGGYYRNDWQNSHAFMEHGWHRHHVTHRG
jgi:hypothetical protein